MRRPHTVSSILHAKQHENKDSSPASTLPLLPLGELNGFAGSTKGIKGNPENTKTTEGPQTEDAHTNVRGDSPWRPPWGILRENPLGGSPEKIPPREPP